MNTHSKQSEPIDIDEALHDLIFDTDNQYGWPPDFEPDFNKAKAAIAAHYAQRIADVDRLEVIDETGRAYVKGSIYGTPVKVKLDYQDNGKTLKVFVEPREDV